MRPGAAGEAARTGAAVPEDAPPRPLWAPRPPLQPAPAPPLPASPPAANRRRTGPRCARPSPVGGGAGGGERGLALPGGRRPGVTFTGGGLVRCGRQGGRVETCDAVTDPQPFVWGTWGGAQRTGGMGRVWGGLLDSTVPAKSCSAFLTTRG